MMKTSILICATCLLVTGCSAQFRLPSLSSALSSLTGLGASSSNSNGGQSGAGSGQSSGSATSQYSGLVRDYGRNLMMAMSNIYPTLFKPPQSQAQPSPQQQQQQGQAMPFESFGASQSQGLFGQGSGGGPSFTLGGSTFSISPSFPFGSLSGASQQQQQSQPQQQQQQQAFPQGPPSGAGSAHSPFSASFGSSINSPSSFGPLSSNPFQMSQSMPSFAPPSSYSAAFEAANGGPAQLGANSASLFGAINSQPAGGHSFGSIPSASQLQAQASSQFGASSLPAGFGSSQHDPTTAQILGQSSHHQPQSISPQQIAGANSPGSHQAGPYGSQSQQVGQQAQQSQSAQFGAVNSQQFRPDMMSIAASAPVPSSYSSYSNYGSIPAQQHQPQGQQQQQQSSSSYQQPSYR